MKHVTKITHVKPALDGTLEDIADILWGAVVDIAALFDIDIEDKANKNS